MAEEISPISHLEKVITGQESPISHLEKIIALYGGSGGSGVGSEALEELNNKIEALKSTQSLEYEGESATCNNTLASRTSDMFIKGKTYVNLGTGGLESAGEKENKISILSNNNKPEDDIDYKEDKKEILLPIEGGLKSLSNGVDDTIEQRNDGVYLVQRVGKVVLNGSEQWELITTQIATKTLYCQIYLATLATNNLDIICDKIKFLNANYLWTNDVEGIGPNDKGKLHFRINRSRLSTQDVNGLKAWLQTNPVTVYYALKTPIETKLNINNLDLEVYEGTTCITTDNAIQPTLSFKVPFNIGGVMQTNSQNINKLYKLIDEVIIPQLINNSADIEILKLK